MSESLEVRVDKLEAKVGRLEERLADIFSKMQSLNESAAAAVAKMSKVAEAAAGMSEATRKLLAEKEARQSIRKKH